MLALPRRMLSNAESTQFDYINNHKWPAKQVGPGAEPNKIFNAAKVMKIGWIGYAYLQIGDLRLFSTPI